MGATGGKRGGGSKPGPKAGTKPRIPSGKRHTGGKKDLKKPPRILVMMRRVLESEKSEDEPKMMKALREYQEQSPGAFLEKLLGLEKMYFQSRNAIRKRCG